MFNRMSSLNNDLLWAANDNKFNKIKQLINNGANINVIDKDGDTPLIITVSNYNINKDIILFLIEKGADINIQNKEGNTALLKALDNDANIKIIQLLLEKGADTNIKNNDGNTPLLIAMNEYPINNNIIKLLIEKGADINVKDNDGNTPLLIAMNEYPINNNIIKLLIEKGADINVKNNDGNIPLLIAMNEYPINNNIIKLLIEKGADVNVKDNDGNTPLIIAVNNDNLLLVKLLIGKGADITIKNNEGDTAYSISKNMGYTDIKNYFESIDGFNNLANNEYNRLFNNIPELNKTNIPANIPAKCFDPIMSNNVNIDNTYTVFYIMDNTNKIVSTACLDEDSLKQYLTSKDYVFFRCKDTVPVSAFFINRKNVHIDKPFRVLNLNFKIYVYDKQAKKIKAGKAYILRPTADKLGRIASYDIAIEGGDIVSGNHCGPETDDYIYEILEIKSSEGGKRKKKIKTFKKKVRKSKTYKRNKNNK